MAGGSTKRSSEECVFATTKKKKKISKDKRDQNVLKEKTTSVCNEDSRQKKAFFAYFGKSFDDCKDDNSSAETNRDGGDSDVKKNGVKESTSTGDNDGQRRLQTPVSKNEEKASADASRFIKYTTF